VLVSSIAVDWGFVKLGPAGGACVGGNGSLFVLSIDLQAGLEQVATAARNGTKFS
jgi:hypothetical protein